MNYMPNDPFDKAENNPMVPKRDRPTGSLEGIKYPDDAISDFGKMSENGHYWYVFQPQGRFIERYLDGDLAICFRRAERGSTRTAKHDGFMFQMAPLRPRSPDIHRNVQASRTWPNLDEPPVFPQNVQLVESVERSVPSFVRSKVFDRGSLPLGEPLFRFEGFNFIQEIGGTCANWKMDTSVEFHAVAADYGDETQIKTTAKRIDDGANLSIKDSIWWSKTMEDHQKIASHLRIRLHCDYIWAAPHVVCDTIFQVWDLGYGPVDSGLSIKKVIAHGNAHSHG